MVESALPGGAIATVPRPGAGQAAPAPAVPGRVSGDDARRAEGHQLAPGAHGDRVCPPVDPDAGARAHRVHRPPVRAGWGGRPAGLAGVRDRGDRPGPGPVRAQRGAPGRVQAADGQALPGRGRGRVRAGGIPAGPVERGPGTAAGSRPAHWHPGHRRRRHLRPGRLQRPAAARAEGPDERGRAALADQQDERVPAGCGPPRRAALRAAGRLHLRPGRPDRARPRRRGGRSHRRPVRRVHRGWLGLRRGRRGRRAALPPPRLRRGVGRGAAGGGGALTPPGAAESLRTPAYAGAYVFGRRRTRQVVDPDGSVRSSVTKLPPGEWEVLIPGHHEGYITWEQYLANQAKLAANRTNTGARPPREGPALCQGIMFCGSCGRAMGPRYKGGHAYYECSHSRADHVSTPGCRSVRADTVDTAVTDTLLDAVAPRQP